MLLVKQYLESLNISNLYLDHFAIIDLPGPQTGIDQLNQIFSALGFIVQGRDYLPEKQNDFLWLTESDSLNQAAQNVLPQVVVADFRLDELPLEIRKIIEKYAKQNPPSPLTALQKQIGAVYLGDHAFIPEILNTLEQYFSGRTWAPPSKKEFLFVQEFNELLAWVLIFGRRANHFTLSVHLLDHFQNIHQFGQVLEKDLKLTLNREGGAIKGNKSCGIAQGSTLGKLVTVPLSDGNVTIRSGFVEFVWRYPNPSLSKPPRYWNDFFTGFIARQANHVIQSLYGNES